MRTVAIINQKGGCGKTTTAINLAACLARLQQRTLLVDMDPQGHCATGLAVPEAQVRNTIFHALLDGPVAGGKHEPATMDKLTWQIASDLDLAPSDLRLAAFEPLFAGKPGRESRLKAALSGVAGRYDRCIIDCPPGVGLLTFNALVAADEVIIPVETGYFSLHGLGKMLETLADLRGKLGKQHVIRILPTLYDTRTKLAREVLSELRAKFKGQLMQSVVNFNTKLKEAASYGQPITEYDPGSRGYRDFVNLAKELMGQPQVERGKLSRPAELVERARQLQQLTNHRFGKGGIPEFLTTPTPAPVKAAEPAASEVEAAQAPAPTVAEKLEVIYGVRQVGATVSFTCRFESAREVAIAGDFNGWSAVTPMNRLGRGEPGTFTTSLPLAEGRYRYRLIVDGKWVTDPHNAAVETNQFGELNNVIEVRPTAGHALAAEPSAA